MKKIPTFLLALIIGSILEGISWVLIALLGQFGRDGVPLNGFAALMNIHYLGFKVEQLLYATLHPNYSAIDYRVRNLVVVVGTTIVLWSVIAFVVISIVRRLYGRKNGSAA